MDRMLCKREFVAVWLCAETNPEKLIECKHYAWRDEDFKQCINKKLDGSCCVAAYMQRNRNDQ